MNSPLTNPYSIDILAPNAGQAVTLAARPEFRAKKI